MYEEHRIPVDDGDPFADATLNDPYPFHDRLRELGPVVRLGRYETFALARHEPVNAALRDPETFCSSAGVGLSDFRKEKPWRPPSLLLEADPPEHTKARGVITQVITLKSIRALRDDFAARADVLTGELAARRRFDGIADLAEAFPLSVFPDAVGLTDIDRRKLLPYGTMVFNTFGPRNANFERTAAAAEGVKAWIAQHCEKEFLADGGYGRRIHEVAAAEGFSEGDAELLVRSFLTAGVDTTVHGLGNALFCLANHPDQWDALREDPSLARNAFDETIRFEAPVQTFFRTTTRAVDVDGVTIPEGSKVLLFLAAANRDPRHWEEADRFDIGRTTQGHVGFGAGIHACVGQMFARLEGEVVLEALARNVRRLELDGPPERMLNNTLRGLLTLPLTVRPA